MSLENKTDVIAFPLTEEKNRFWFFRLYEKRCARCVNVAPLRELFHATVAMKKQRSQRVLTTIKFPASKIIWCRYNFLEIKRPELLDPPENLTLSRSRL
jgi:hypothetical protein